jgi:hypothetical protein
MASTLQWLTAATTRSGWLLLGVPAVWQGSFQMLQICCLHAQAALLANPLVPLVPQMPAPVSHACLASTLLMMVQPALAALLASSLVPLVPQMPALVSHACLASTLLLLVPQLPAPAQTALLAGTLLLMGPLCALHALLASSLQQWQLQHQALAQTAQVARWAPWAW